MQWGQKPRGETGILQGAQRKQLIVSLEGDGTSRPRLSSLAQRDQTFPGLAILLWLSPSSHNPTLSPCARICPRDSPRNAHNTCNPPCAPSKPRLCHVYAHPSPR